MRNNKYCFWIVLLFLTLLASTGVYAGEADIKIPDLTQVKFDGLGGVSGLALMYFGIGMCAIGAIFGLVQYKQTKALPVHKSMGNVSNIIWETCKTYLLQQGKFLVILWVLIAACMRLLLRRACSDEQRRRRRRDPALLDPGHPRLLRRGLVRHPHQHARQLAARPSPPSRATRWRRSASR